MYHTHFSHEGNTGAMFHDDLIQWIMNALDTKLTGEFNASVDQAKNPKAKRAIPPKLATNRGETFFRRESIAPPRWWKIIQASKTQRRNNQPSPTSPGDAFTNYMLKIAENMKPKD